MEEVVMSLDIAILDVDGSPKEQVSIGVEDHHRLMNFASERKARLVLRLDDYYGDAEFGTGELELLIREASILREQSPDDRLVWFLEALIQLARRAQSAHQPLTVIAD
jgi:hypothetical protein